MMGKRLQHAPIRAHSGRACLCDLMGGRGGGVQNAEIFFSRPHPGAARASTLTESEGGGGSRSCAALTRVRNAERCGVYAAAASEQLMLGGGGGREGRGGCHISESNSAAPPRASRRLGFSRVRVRRSTAARAHSYTHRSAISACHRLLIEPGMFL